MNKSYQESLTPEEAMIIEHLRNIEDGIVRVTVEEGKPTKVDLLDCSPNEVR